MPAYTCALLTALCVAPMWGAPQRPAGASEEAALRRALASGRDDAATRGTLGLLLYRSVRFEEAVEQLGRAAQLDPANAEYSLKLAASLLALRRYPVALEFLRAIDPRFGKMAEYQYNLGLALYGTRQYDRALIAFDAATSIDPKLDGAWFFIGNTRAVTGELEKSVEFYRRAIELNPRQAGYYFALGKVLAELGPEHDAEAAANFRSALKLRSDDVPSKLGLGRACERMGDLRCALPLLEDVAARFPDEVAPHVILSRIYVRLNQPEKAEAEREAVRRIERLKRASGDGEPRKPTRP